MRAEDPAVTGTLYFRLSNDGRVTELFIDGGDHEITPAQLRRLPLARLKAQAKTRTDLWLGMSTLNGAPDPGIREQVERAFPDSGRHRPVRVKLKPPLDGLTDDFLKQVGKAYQSAVAHGEKPNIALAEQTGHPRRTVERWVYLARKGGHLR